MPKRHENDNPWAHVTNPQVGDVVRIKQVPGTKYASTRRPVWAVVISVFQDRVFVRCFYSDFAPAMTLMDVRGGRWVLNLPFHCIMPAPKRIPDAVKLTFINDRIKQALRS